MAKKSDYYDSAWPDDSGAFVLVDVLKHQYASDSGLSFTLFERIEQTCENVLEPPDKIWLFLLEDPALFAHFVPDRWKNLKSPRGGVPRNVWAGVRLACPDHLVRLPELRRIRTKRRFAFFDFDPATLTGEQQAFLHHELNNCWRCTSCGVRGDEPQRDCANHFLCDRDTLAPQIDWLIGPIQETPRRGLVWPKRPPP